MSELVRHLRHGGPAALAAAKKLLESKPKLSPTEVAEVKKLLPQLKDLFGAKLSEGLSTMLSGLEHAVPVPVELLMPKLEQLKEPKQLPARFGTDLQLVRPQLTNHPQLSREQKAERLFHFFVPFAVKVVQLPEAARQEVAPKLLEQAKEAGFAQLVDKPTQRDGVQVAKQLLDSPAPEQVHEQVKALQLDAPTWPETPKPQQQQHQPAQQTPQAQLPDDTAARESETARQTSQPASVTAPNAQQPQRLDRREEAGSPQTAADNRTNKRLGGRMLWNVLHLFRDDGKDGRESAAQRETMNQLAVGMILALGLLTLLALLILAVH